MFFWKFYYYLFLGKLKQNGWFFCLFSPRCHVQSSVARSVNRGRNCSEYERDWLTRQITFLRSWLNSIITNRREEFLRTKRKHYITKKRTVERNIFEGGPQWLS